MWFTQCNVVATYDYVLLQEPDGSFGCYNALGLKIIKVISRAIKVIRWMVANLPNRSCIERNFFWYLVVNVWWFTCYLVVRLTSLTKILFHAIVQTKYKLNRICYGFRNKYPILELIQGSDMASLAWKSWKRMNINLVT